MATMNVAMSLTLADAASGPLRAFTAIVEQLEAAANGATTRLNALAASITKTGAALGSVDAQATAAMLGLGALEVGVSSLGGALSSAIAKITEASASLKALGASGIAAGAGVASGAETMASGLAATNKEANALSGTLKGIAALWAAAKIETGLKDSVSEAAQFQTGTATVASLGLGANRTSEIARLAEADSANLKFVSVNEALKSRMAAMGGLATTDQSVINEILPAAMTLANNLRQMGEKGTLEDMVRNALGMAEARGQTHDPAGMKGTFDFIQKAFTATGGKIDMRDWEAMLRQLGQGAANISDEGLFNLIGVMDQVKISGGANSGGGAQRVGTSFKMLQAYGLGKSMSNQAVELFSGAGLLNPDAVMAGGDGLKKNIKTGGFRDASLLAEDPVGWMMKQMPAIMAYVQAHRAQFFGKEDINDPAAQAVALQKFITGTGFSVTAAAAMGIALQPKTAARIREQTEIAKGASGVDETKKLLDETFLQNVTDFKAQMESLATVIGTALLPALTEVAKVFTDLFTGIAAFMRENPIVAQFVAWGAVIGTVTLAIAGLAALFGPLLLAFGGAGPVFAAMGVAATAALGGILAALGPVTFAVGLFFSAWTFGSWLANLEVGGQQVRTWGADLIEYLVNKFNQGWAVISGLTTKIANAMPVIDAGSGFSRLFGQGAQADGNYGNEGRRTAQTSSGSLAIDFGTGDGWGSSPAARAAVAGKSTGGRAGGGGGRAGRATKADYLGAIQGDGAGQEQAKVNFLRSEKAVYGELGKIEADQAKESAKLDKDKLDLERELLLTSGQRHASEALRAEQEIAAKVQALLLSHRITQEEADNFLARAHAATELKLRTEEIGKIQSAYADRLADTQNAERNGMLSQTASEDEMLRLRKEEAKVLDEEIAKQLVLAEAAGDEVTILRLKKQQRQNDAVSGQLPSDQIQILKSAQAGFGNFFNSILSHTKSVKDAFRDLGHSILDTINQVVSKRLGDALFDSLFGAFFGQQGAATGAGLGGSSGLGAMFGGIFGGLFGGGSANAAGGAASAGFGTGAGFGNLDFGGFFASGIDNVPNDMLAVIHKGERVVTAADNARGGGGRTQVNHINVSPPAGMSKQSATQLGATIAKQIEMAGRRNN